VISTVERFIGVGPTRLITGRFKTGIGSDFFSTGRETVLITGATLTDLAEAGLEIDLGAGLETFFGAAFGAGFEAFFGAAFGAGF
jgi:hypothetical protein